MTVTAAARPCFLVLLVAMTAALLSPGQVAAQEWGADAATESPAVTTRARPGSRLPAPRGTVSSAFAPPALQT